MHQRNALNGKGPAPPITGTPASAFAGSMRLGDFSTKSGHRHASEAQSSYSRKGTNGIAVDIWRQPAKIGL